MAGLVPATVKQAMAAAAARFADVGIETARLDARVLVGHALARDDGWLIGHGDDLLDADATEKIEALVVRRLARQPVAQIVGAREFWSLPFRVTPATLTPRPDSETLIAAALEILTERNQSCRILDLGTGSGCLLLTLLSELPGATGIGIDISADALLVARGNARDLAVEERGVFRQGSWFEALRDGDGPFDLVVANPPYIPEAEIAGLQPEVSRYEPRSALSGGADGLDAYREIAAGLDGQLTPTGVFIGEFGDGQHRAVSKLLNSCGFRDIDLKRDLAGIFRCCIARRRWSE